MGIEDALYTYLSNHEELSKLVGTRIYPDHLPESPNYPAIVFNMISSPQNHTMGKDPGIACPRYEFTCWGKTKPNAKNVASQLIAALKDYSGTMGTKKGESEEIAVEGIAVQRIFLDDEFDDEMDPIKGTYSRVLEFIIWYEE